MYDSDARLEIQGVYGDGWDEGIERTRERAIAAQRRQSVMPGMKGSDLEPREQEVLGKVDR